MAKVQGNAAKPTKAPKEKRAGRAPFAGVGSKDTSVYPFKVAVPEGFNFKTNKQLKKKDFASAELYFNFRAAEMDAKAQSFRDQAIIAKAEGTGTERGKAKRLIKLTEKMAELKKQLQEQGIDVEELLKSAATKDTA
jgi:hypothetical protein